MVTEQAAQQLVGLMIFGCLGSCAIGIMLGILIKHFIDLPCILACKFAKEKEDVE